MRDSPRSRRSTTIVREHAIDADFEWVDGYLHAPLRDDKEDASEGLKEDATLAESWASMPSLSTRRAARRTGPGFASPVRRACSHAVPGGRGQGVRGSSAGGSTSTRHADEFSRESARGEGKWPHA